MLENEVRKKMDFSSCKVQKQQRQMHTLFRTLNINIISLILCIISVIFFAVYRKIVDIYLKFKLGNAYGGVLASEDVLFFMGGVSECHITTVTYARCQGKIDMVKRIKDILQEKIFDNPDHYPKLTSTVHQFGGYYYRKKHQCNINDVVKEIKLVDSQQLTEEYLKKYTAKVTNAEFGKNGTVLWDIHVGPCPITELNSVYTYPIISRFHHSIADGTSLVSLLIQVYGNKSSENYSEKLFRKLLSKPKRERKQKSLVDWLVFVTVNFIKTASLYLEVIFISLGRILEANQLRVNDINALHGTNYTGEKICAWASEDKVECIPLVKSIKNRRKTKFSCVVFTAVAASLSQYFKRNGFPIPEYISGFTTLLLDYPDVDMSKPVALKNKTGGLMFELPMIYGSKTLPEALKNVSDEWNRQIRLADGLAITFLMRYMAYIPMSLLRMNFGWTAHTYAFTNVPGGSHIITQDGWVFEKIIPVAPNMVEAGLSIALLSYDEKFQIGVLIDKKLVQSQEEVQKIADDILFYINKLDSQTK